MQLRDCVLLLPSYELDGYPRQLPADEAELLLSGWLAMWHPYLIAHSQCIARWHQVEHPPSDLSETAFIVPNCATDDLPSDLEENITKAGSVLLRPTAPWRECQAELLAAIELDGPMQLRPPAAGEDSQQSDASSKASSELEADLVDEFAALGYAYLQIQLMTRQMRYTSNLDVALFTEQAIEAAEATTKEDWETASRMLQACFDSLGQERDHYYSLDVNLVDLTLLAPTTLGKSITKQLSHREQTSYLTTADLLSQLDKKSEESSQALKELVQDGTACLIGGLQTERPHPLMTRESIARDFHRGRDAFSALGYQPPTVFGRMAFGMTAESAAMLRRFDFDGALLVAPTSGTYPEGNQAKISWESSDGTFINAIAGSLLDASSASSFHSLGWTIGEALDHEHVPTIVFAHWPSRGCNFLKLLRIIAKRTPALGKWTLADEYFRDTDQPYHQEQLDAKQFHFNWLALDPRGRKLVTRTQSFHKLQVQIRSLQNLLNLAWQLENPSPKSHPVDAPVITTEHQQNSGQAEVSGDSSTDDSEADTQPDTPEPPMPTAMPSEVWSGELQQAIESADGLFEAEDPASVAGNVQQKLNAIADDTLARLAKKLSRKSHVATESAQANARLLVNPYSCPVRIATHLSNEKSFDTDADWCFAEGRVGDDRVCSIDVPSLGFVSGRIDHTVKSIKQPLLAEVGGLLKNEFLEAQVDAHRGHLKSLHVPAKRGNRLSVMIARRTRNEKGEVVYSDMVASRVRMLTSSNMAGRVRAIGSLEFEGKRVGDFEIDYEVQRGNRILELELKLSNLQPLGDANPWRAAYVARLAWPTEAAIVRTYSSGGRQSWAGAKTIAPTLIEIDDTDFHTQYLTGGLAFHRRTESRFLETILATEGEQEVHHRIGIGVDLPNPTLSANRFLDRRYEIPLTCDNSLDMEASGWLATANVKNVNVDLECPLVDEAGELVGIRLFLTESAGKSTTATIRLFREVDSAMRVDYLGNKVGKLTTDGDALTIAVRSGEQVNVNVIWK